MPLRLALLAAVVVLALPGTGTAQAPRLLGTVGPGFTISLTDASGNAVTRLDPGTYEIVVTDRAEIHNFHLAGPGVNMRTEVEAVGTVTWTVTFTDGVYEYVCDPHASAMRGTFTVGTPPAAPPPPATPVAPAPGRLNASVGPGFTIGLRTVAGRAVRTVRAGPYTVSVRDRSRIHNFHLTGPGVNRRTTVPFAGSARWSVRFRQGRTYRFVCDPHARTMRGSFRAT
jgi:plastocyanin